MLVIPISDADAYRAARSIWIRGSIASDLDDTLTVLKWAVVRWPGVTLPTNPKTLALWVLSISFQDGFTP